MPVINVDVGNFDEELKKSIRYKIPYLSKEITCMEEEEGVLYIQTTEQDLEALNEKIQQFIKETTDTYREYCPEVIFENKQDLELKKDNIYDELVKRDWIVHYENGLIGMGKEFLKLFNYFDQTFVRWAKEYGAEEYVYPDLISIDTLNQYKYLSQFPNHIMFASHIQQDMKKVEEFGKNISKGCGCLNDQYLETPRLVNKSAVCTHVYAQYENRKVDKPVIITSVGKCKRYESLNMTMVERLLDFSMREIVLIGSPEFVLETRNEFIGLAGDLVRNLNLKANIKTGNDPFFTSTYSPKALMQKKCKLKYELNVLLPYNQKELSVGSFNYHGDYFTDAFNIKSTDSTPVHTGCIAFGLERFVYAYLSQIGLDNIPLLS